MPNYKRKRSMTVYRPRKKRAAKKYDQGVITKLNIRRGIFGFPDTLRTQLRYADVFILTSTVGSVAEHAMRMNSLYDPDFTGTGHQPYFYDQLASVYSRYSVVKSTMKCKFSLVANSTGTAQPSGPCMIGVKTDDDATSAGTVYTALEAGATKSDILNNALGGNNVKTLSIDYIPTRDLGISHTNDSLVSLTNTNPTRPWYGTFFVAESGLASPTAVVVKLEMIFDVIFTQQVTVASS